MIQTQQLKNGWEWKKLGDICIGKAKYGSGAKKSNFDGKVRYVRITDIDNNGNLKEEDFVSPSIIEEEYFLEEGDLLFARSGSVGRTYLHNKSEGLKYQFAGYLILFKLNPEVAMPKYVFYITQSKYYENWISLMKRSMTISNINAKEYASLEIPVPPLEVQKQIVAVLERAEKLKQRREQVNTEMKSVIQSIFIEMFGDPIKNDKGFVVEEFENIASKEKYGLKRGPFGGSLKKEIFVSDGYKVYEQQHAIKNNFELGNYYVTSEKYEEMKPFAVHPEDILISCSGTIGKIAIVPKDAKPGIINQALLKLTIDKEKATPIFVKYLLETPSVQRLFFGTARGSGIQNVASMPFIKSTKIPVPPLSLQKEFEKIVEKVESIKKYQIGVTEETNILFDALMQKAFNGEL